MHFKKQITKKRHYKRLNSRHLLSAGDFAQNASNVCERRTLIGGFVPAGLDEFNERLAEFRCFRQLRTIWDALSVTHAVHNVCSQSNMLKVTS